MALIGDLVEFYSKTSDFAEVEVGTAVGVSMR
jgi:hypothetical protein